MSRRAGTDDRQVAHQGAAPSGHRGAEGDAAVALTDQADIAGGRADRAVGIDSIIGRRRALPADVDLAGDGDRRERGHEAVIATGRRRARRSGRDTTDQRSTLHGQVAGGDRQRLPVKINARRARAALTRKHDVSGHTRIQQSGEIQASGGGGVTRERKRSRGRKPGSRGRRDARAGRGVTRQGDRAELSTGARRQSGQEIDAARGAAAGEGDIARRRGDQTRGGGHDALRTRRTTDEGDVTRGSAQRTGERDALRGVGQAHAEADGVIEIDQARERNTRSGADGCPLGEDAQAGLTAADGGGRDRPVKRDGGRVGPRARIEDQVR